MIQYVETPGSKGGKVASNVYFTRDQHDWLRAESARTGVPIARLVRSGIELLRQSIASSPRFGEAPNP